ncbi:hypothetical protein [Duganella sp. BuS-21]|uniref:hypothetical protein n=1 Tax=Duganella sp. BuS-21 TaxID=2943848 RepID=UPI0035A71152
MQTAESLKQNEYILVEHFDITTVTVSRKTSSADMDALGIKLTDEQLAALCGAPSGSTVEAEFIDEAMQEISEVNDKEKVEEIPPGLHLKVKNKDYINDYNHVILYPAGEEDGPISMEVYVKLVDFRSGAAKGKSFTGVGGYMIARIVRMMKQLKNFTKIRLQAAGGRTWKSRKPGERWYGYVAWPRYGFDMELRDFTTQMFPFFQHQPVGLSSCVRVSQVLALGKDGEAFWKAVGDGWDMTFDVTANCSSIEKLSKCLDFEV